MSRQHRRKDLSSNLQGLMRQQLGITNAFWTDLVGCTKGRPDYLAVHGHDTCG